MEKSVRRVLRDMEQAPDSTERKERIIGLLGPAKDDLKACMILYNSKLYALSTYHLQQGTEKATKAYLLFSGIMSVDVVRGIKHDSLRGHILLAEKILSYMRGPGVDPSVSIALKNLNLLRKVNREEVARLKYSQIRQLLRAVDLTTTNISALLSQLVEKDEIRENVQAIVKQVGYDGPLVDEEIDKALRCLNDEAELSQIVGYVTHLTFLYVASAVTFPHEAHTRYSDDIIKPKDYTMRMGIVKATPELNRRVMDVVNFMVSELQIVLT